MLTKYVTWETKFAKQQTFESLTWLLLSDLLKHSITQNVYVDILL